MRILSCVGEKMLYSLGTIAVREHGLLYVGDEVRGRDPDHGTVCGRQRPGLLVSGAVTARSELRRRDHPLCLGRKDARDVEGVRFLGNGF